MGATSLLNVTGDWAASAIAQPPRKTVTKPALIIVTSRNQGAPTDSNILLRNFFQWNRSAPWVYCTIHAPVIAVRSLPDREDRHCRWNCIKHGGVTRRAVVWLAASGNPGATHGTGYPADC